MNIDQLIAAINDARAEQIKLTDQYERYGNPLDLEAARVARMRVRHAAKQLAKALVKA